MSASVEKIPYAGWPNCYRLTNGRLELVITSDVGPRVIRCGFIGGPNEFAEFEEDLGKTGGDVWRIYGGHRLWHSPESRARTYFPDNHPVQAEPTADGLRVIQPLETNCGIRKIITLVMDRREPRVTVEHELRNEGVWPVEMAVWCLSVMAPGGTAVIPQPRESDAEGLLPNRVLVLWPYTMMNDPRYTWGNKLIRLRQDARRGPTKIGLSVTAGWGAYCHRGHLFLKQFAFAKGAPYPDGGASVELYTNERMLELETLSPLCSVKPGETIKHTEVWTLVDGFDLPEDEDAALKAIEGHLAAV